MSRRNRLVALIWLPLVAAFAIAPGSASYASEPYPVKVIFEGADYVTKGSIPDYDCGPATCSAAQGFAVTLNYLFSIKTDGDSTRSVIYRTNRETGDRVQMSNDTSHPSYNTWLGHANDMAIVTVNGDTYMFVVTLNEDINDTDRQLVLLKYEGTKYERVGSYTVHRGSVLRAVSGISKLSQSGNTVTFFFSSGDQLYTGDVDVTAPSGSDIQLDGSFVMGDRPAGWHTQGIHYDPAGKRMYRAVSNVVNGSSGNKSRILIYPDIDAGTSGTQYADTEYRYTESSYSKFEIEGLGINSTSGKLYFNTNRNGNADGVHYVKDFHA